jgi:hypothetical protein
VDIKLRNSNASSGVKPAVRPLLGPGGRQPGSLLSFVPAHIGSKAGPISKELSRTMADALGVAVLLADLDARGLSSIRSSEEHNLVDFRTWRSLVSQLDGLDVLDAPEIDPAQLRQLLEYTRESYAVICANLAYSRKPAAMEVMRASDAIFLVADSDPVSLAKASEKAEWMRSMGLADQCGLLLRKTPRGVNPNEAEECTGIPLCSLIDSAGQLEQLAVWLSAAHGSSRCREYALAV